VKIDSTITGFDGQFTFDSVKCGNYTIKASFTQVSTSGITPIDALLVNRFYMNLYNFPDALKEKAADVNKDGKVDPTDALNINRFYIRLITNFKAGQWVFEDIVVNVNGIDSIYVVKGNCVGDANSDWKKDYRKMMNLSVIQEGEILTEKGSIVDIPVKVTKDLMLGAIGLLIDYDKSFIKIEGIETGIDGMIFNISDNSASIAWATLNKGILLKQGESICILKARIIKECPDINNCLSLNAESLFADEQATELKGELISFPKLVFTDKVVLTPSIYPNPAHSFIVVSYLLLDKSKSVFELLDVTGKVLQSKLISENLTNVDISDLAKGVYIIKITDNNGVLVRRVIKE
jgi:hypothetical protein